MSPVVPLAFCLGAVPTALVREQARSVVVAGSTAAVFSLLGAAESLRPATWSPSVCYAFQRGEAR